MNVGLLPSPIDFNKSLASCVNVLSTVGCPAALDGVGFGSTLSSIGLDIFSGSPFTSGGAFNGLPVTSSVLNFHVPD